MPAPFNPYLCRQSHVNPTFANVHARSTAKNKTCRFFATMMKPIGQVITRRAMPRQIQRSTFYSFAEISSIKKINHERRKREGADHSRRGQQHAHSGLLVDQAIALRIVVTRRD